MRAPAGLALLGICSASQRVTARMCRQACASFDRSLPAAGRPYARRGRPNSNRPLREAPARSSRGRSTVLRHLVRRSGDNPIEEMTSGAVLDFEDPGVGVEAEFQREAFLDLCLRRWLLSVAPADKP